MAEVNVCKLG